MPQHKHKPDAVRRERQSDRLVRILRVHRMYRGESRTIEQVREIADIIGVSERTIYRDIATLDRLYEKLGTSLIDG